ncbi:MAG: hypothetical protein V4631_21900 [Pseudomonadota bacterium]
MQKYQNLMRGGVILAALFAASLAGCDRTATSAPAAAGASGAEPAYELVTERRPDSFSAQVRIQKAAYDMCVAAAKNANLPVKPFVVAPPDYVLERTTYRFDGKSYYMKQQHFSVDITDTFPEKGCVTRIAEGGVINRAGNGVNESVDIDIDGKRVAGSDPMPPSSRFAGDTDAYTVARTEGGVALKCQAPDNPGLHPGLITALCIVDAGNGRTLRNADGSPLVAYLRDEASAAMSSAAVVVPVSLQLGKTDTTAFSGALK